MLPLTRSRNRSRFFGIPFSPASLFANGEQGAWYDSSDLSTMFNDAAGTQPITSFTTNQPVGLLLDKSKGLVLGPELVTNGDFDTDSDWTKGTGWTISGGKANGAAGTASNLVSVSPVVTAGKTYQVEFELSNVSAGSVTVYAGLTGTGVNTGAITANGSYKYFLVGGTSDQKIYIQKSSTFVGSIDNISVRELPGNHATASGSARPVLSKRYNLLTRTEEFNDAVWGKTGVTVTSNAATAPNGTITADRLITNSGSSALWYLQQIPSGASGSLRFSIAAKADTASHIGFSSDTGAVKAAVNLATGTVSLNGFGITAINLGDGWYNISWTAIGDRVRIFSSTTAITAANQAVTGDGASGVLIWGADLRRTIDANAFQPAYQRVVTATDYDGDGFLPYLEYSGAQAMATGSVDFSATDKVTVFAGVTKLSDATGYGMIAENTTGAGSFSLAAPADSTTPTYFCTVAGTSRTSYKLSTYTAPHSASISVAMDIAGATRADELFPRINGAIPTLTGADNANAGTGNFGNYPLYIGARVGTSLFFNGRQYSLIIRGAQSSDAQISATESWVAQRTGVAL